MHNRTAMTKAPVKQARTASGKASQIELTALYTVISSKGIVKLLLGSQDPKRLAKSSKILIDTPLEPVDGI